MAQRQRKKEGPKRYASYSRCSSDDQAQGDFTTIDTQRELNKSHIAEQSGTLVKEYVDEGKTGTNLKRPGYKQMIADAEAGVFDVVCVTYMSRLARGVAYYHAEYELKEAKVSIETVREKFTSDMAGHLNKQLTIMMDGTYPQMVGEWTRTKQEQMVKHGYFTGGLVPFGLKAEFVSDPAFTSRNDKEPPKRLVPDATYGEVARQAFWLFLEKGTIAAARDYLNTVTDRKWDTSKVKYLLTNEVYLGVLTFGGHRNETAYEPLIDRATWDAVQAALGQKPSRSARNDEGSAYYLRGLVKCPHCGCSYTHHYVTRGGKTIRYYACLNAMKRLTKCPVGRINIETLHETVLHEIDRAARHKTVMHRIIAQSGGWQEPDDARKALRGQIAKKMQFNGLQIANINKAVAGGGNFRSLLTTLEKLEKEEDALRQELQSVETEIEQMTIKRPTAEQVQAQWGQLLPLWKDATDEERQILMVCIVRKVEIKQKDLVVLELFPTPEVQGHCLRQGRTIERGSDSN